MPLYFDGDLRYLRFNITKHYSQVIQPIRHHSTVGAQVKDAKSAVQFVQPLFDFVGEALSNGDH